MITCIDNRLCTQHCKCRVVRDIAQSCATQCHSQLTRLMEQRCKISCIALTAHANQTCAGENMGIPLHQAQACAQPLPEDPQGPGASQSFANVVLFSSSCKTVLAPVRQERLVLQWGPSAALIMVTALPLMWPNLANLAGGCPWP